MLSMFESDEKVVLKKELLKDSLNEKKVQKLLDSEKIDINARDSKGKTLIFELVNKKRLESIKLLIKNGADLKIEDDYGKTILNEAKSDTVMINFLLTNGVDINYVNSSGRTIIQDTAIESNSKVFKVLMSYNPDLTNIDKFGQSVLFDAVEGGNLNIINEVLKNLKNINMLDSNGQTALFHAVLKDNDRIAKFLIDNGIDFNIYDNNMENVLFNTLILGASNIEIFDLLLQKGINLNTKDGNDRSLLDEILNLLAISKDSDTRYENKYKFVHERCNYLKLTTYLIENRLAVNRKDKDGKTVLYREVQRENYEIIKFLISSGANVNTEDNTGRTVFHDACLKGLSNLKMIDFLIEREIDIEHRDVLENSIVHDLVEIILVQGHYKKVNFKRSLNFIDDEDYFGLLKRLLILKPKLNEAKKNGETVIFDTITYANLDLIKLLINNGADANISDYEGNTPLSRLIDDGLTRKTQKEREQFLERIVFLLKFRIDLNITDEEGKTVFHKTVISNDIEVIEKLLTKKVDLDIRDKQGRTALHHTQWKGNYKIAKLLISAGADMNVSDAAGFTILNYAALLGHVKLVTILIDSGVYMYNKANKSKVVSKLFAEKLLKNDILTNLNISDKKMKTSMIEALKNLKKELAVALKE